MALFAIHLTDRESLVLKKVRFSVEGLTEWLSLAAIRHDADPASNTVQLTYTTPQPVVVNLEGKKVSFEFRWLMSPGLPVLGSMGSQSLGGSTKTTREAAVRRIIAG